MSARANGFTLVEVVVAIAVAAMLIVIVSAVARSSLQAARRQESASTEAALGSSAEELLRRDLAGWSAGSRILLPHSPAGSAQSADNSEQQRFSFTTSSDAVRPDEAPARHCRVTYVIRSALGECELQRIEESTGAAAVLSLLRGKGPMRFEFFDGTRWTGRWPQAERPAAIRFTSARLKFIATP